MGFYYDDMMENDASTIRLYLLEESGQQTTIKEKGKSEIKEVPWITRSKSKTQTMTPLIKGVINMTPSLSSTARWGEPGAEATSVIASFQGRAAEGLQKLQNFLNTMPQLFAQGSELAKTILNAGRNKNNQISDSNIAKALDYDQTQYHTINEYIKVFQGYTESSPIPLNFTVIPYINKAGEYLSVTKQLTDFLTKLYPDDPLEFEFNSDIQKDKDDSLIEGEKKAIYRIITAATDSEGSHIVKINPPHNFNYVPRTLMRNEWLKDTIALAVGENRILYNLVLQSLSINISNYHTYYDGAEGIEQASVSLTLMPILTITPHEQKNFLLGIEDEYNTPDITFNIDSDSNKIVDGVLVTATGEEIAIREDED